LSFACVLQLSAQSEAASPAILMDMIFGHGTHVAGIIAAYKPDDPENEMTGAAPMAKLVVHDLAWAASNEVDSSLSIPGDIISWWGHSYQLDSKIHSCSWGYRTLQAGGNDYSSGSQKIDQFVHTNDDYLALFAAGNYGGSGQYSVVEPGIAKNVLTVGATENGRSAMEQRETYVAGDGLTRRIMSVAKGDWETIIDWGTNDPRGIANADYLFEDYGIADMNIFDIGKTLTDKAASVGNNNVDMFPVSWGKTLGDNEVVQGMLKVPVHPCACDLTGATSDDILLLQWDWPPMVTRNWCTENFPSYGNTANRGCTLSEAWNNIKTLNPPAVVLIQPPVELANPDTSGYRSADTWNIFTDPPGNDGTIPVFQIRNTPGNLIFGAIAKDFYESDFMEWMYYTYDYYYYTYTYTDFGVNTGTWDFTSVHVTLPQISHDIRAGISSRGPTFDYRFKPDILCPGEAIRAPKSDGDVSGGAAGNCIGDGKSGTSMATPHCAGNMALVRQYLMEGWFGDGTSGSATGLTNPSAALLKAMAVASGQPVRNTATSDYVTVYPNMDVGFGYLSLEHVLMFDNSAHSLFFSDRESVAQDSAVEYCFTVSSSDVPLTVSIAWTDPEALTNVESLLINNIDLVVTGPGSDFFYGNHLEYYDVDNGYKPVRDTVNNVERVKIDAPALGKYHVKVIGSDVPDGPQLVSVVATGAMTEELVSACSAYDECENSCSGHGTCLKGWCDCEPDWTGTDCSFGVTELVSDAAATAITVKGGQTAYYWFDVAAGGSVTLDVTVTSEEADILVAKDKPPVRYGHLTSQPGLVFEDRAVASSTQFAGSGLQAGKYVMAVIGRADWGDDVAITAAVAAGAGTGGLQLPMDPGYAGCSYNGTWPDVTALQQADDSKVFTGGLGSRLQADKYEAWLCLVDHGCSFGASNPFCFVYDEQEEVFKPWGLMGDDLGIF